MQNIIYFNKDLKQIEQYADMKIGIRGRRAIELAAMGLPIAPGFIIDADLTLKLPQVNVKEILKTYIGHLEKDTGKKYGDAEKPMMLKVVLSSDLNVPYFPSIHNIGMNKETVQGFAKFTSEKFAYGEYLFLLRNLGNKIYETDNDDIKKIETKLQKSNKIDDIQKAIEIYEKNFDDKFSEDVYDQLSLILKTAAAKYCDSDIDVDNSLSMMVQVMVYGNFGDNSYAGNYYTRNIVTGENKIQGEFVKNEFDFSRGKAKQIDKIENSYFEKFTEIAHKIEANFKEIRDIKFTIEEGDFWLVEQREVDEKSTQAQIKTLLDLVKEKEISEEYIVNIIKPNQLNELLHPVIDPQTVKSIKYIKGGIAGSTGAAIGRVFFSTEKLLEEHKKAIMTGGDTNLILVMPASYAEDVKAIEVAQGVITTEGGFSSHAPVVARSLGKVAMVQPDMRIRGKAFILSGKTIQEGEYVSMNVPYYDEPTLYMGKVGLIMPDFKKNGLYDFLEIVETFIDEFNVRANADQKRDALVAKDFNAKGIGLCRTEHMFFNEKRIMKFREMIIADNEVERRKRLKALQPMQRSDFYELFRQFSALN